MLAKTTSSLIFAVTKILHPLVKILLRNGIDYGTFTEVVRKVYVDVAFEQLEERGKRPTISGVSAMTGLTRKETKRLKELDKLASDVTHQRYNRATRVISGWLNDKRFLDVRGEPAELSLGVGENSFADLVKAYSGDIPASAMYSVLEASNSIRRIGSHVCLLQKAYIPHADPVEKIDILGADTAELIETISHNLTSPKEQLLFQRKVSNCLIPAKAVQVFRALSAEKSQALLEEMNRWLGAHEKAEPEDIDDANYVALGIYFVQRPNVKLGIGKHHE